MGAAYRSDESLALYFPPYVWKLLIGEHVTWSKDFSNVDAVAVNMISKYMEKIRIFWGPFGDSTGYD
jgi:hypothetical protein